jgi:hypothetical protein
VTRDRGDGRWCGVGLYRRCFSGDDHAGGERLESHRKGELKTLTGGDLDCPLDASEGDARNHNAVAAGRQDKLERAVIY